jgi:hypothetical protein
MVSSTNMKMTCLLFLTYCLFPLCFLPLFYIYFAVPDSPSFVQLSSSSSLFFYLLRFHFLILPLLHIHLLFLLQPIHFFSFLPIRLFLFLLFLLLLLPTLLSSSADVPVSHLLTFSCILHALSILTSSVLSLWCYFVEIKFYVSE